MQIRLCNKHDTSLKIACEYQQIIENDNQPWRAPCDTHTAAKTDGLLGPGWALGTHHGEHVPPHRSVLSNSGPLTHTAAKIRSIEQVQAQRQTDRRTAGSRMGSWYTPWRACTTSPECPVNQRSVRPSATRLACSGQGGNRCQQQRGNRGPGQVGVQQVTRAGGGGPQVTRARGQEATRAFLRTTGSLMDRWIDGSVDG